MPLDKLTEQSPKSSDFYHGIKSVYKSQTCK